MECDPTTGALNKEYVYGSTGLLATIDSANGTQYMTSDHLGSLRVVTDDAGGVDGRHDCKPFGQELPAGVGGRTAGMGFVTDTARKKFTGYERDYDTGLDFAQARYYSPAQGRFTSVDPLTASGSTGNPQTFNRYAYVLNNPLNATDPTGMSIGLDPFELLDDGPCLRMLEDVEERLMEGQQPRQQPDRDGLPRGRQPVQILGNRGRKLDLPFLDQLHDGHARDRFGAGVDGEDTFVCDRDRVLEVGDAV